MVPSGFVGGVFALVWFHCFVLKWLIECWNKLCDTIVFMPPGIWTGLLIGSTGIILVMYYMGYFEPSFGKLAFWDKVKEFFSKDMYDAVKAVLDHSYCCFSDIPIGRVENYVKYQVYIEHARHFALYQSHTVAHLGAVSDLLTAAEKDTAVSPDHCRKLVLNALMAKYYEMKYKSNWDFIIFTSELLPENSRTDTLGEADWVRIKGEVMSNSRFKNYVMWREHAGKTFFKEGEEE